MWWVGVVRAGRRMSYGGLDYLGLLIESWIAFFFLGVLFTRSGQGVALCDLECIHVVRRL
jgi:hypothetical protein